MSVGAFTGVTAAVALSRNVDSGPVLLIVGMIVAALFAALVGFLIGIPVLRLKGDSSGHRHPGLRGDHQGDLQQPLCRRGQQRPAYEPDQ